MKNLHRLAFFVPPRKDHTLFWHQLRDGDGFIFLREALTKAGIKCTLAGIIRNVPDAPPPERFTRNDILAVTTRFPLDDDDSEDLRTVVPGRNQLEQKLFGTARLFFRQLNRSFAVLQDQATPLLKPQYRNRNDVQFSTFRWARCMAYRRYTTQKKRTATYLINIPEVWSGGPALVWSFGLSGETGMIWNKILFEESNYTRLLAAPHFAMAEFDIPPDNVQEQVSQYEQAIEYCGPGTLDWATAKALNLELIAETKLEPHVLASLGLPS